MVNNKDGNTEDRTCRGSLVRYGTGNGVPIQQRSSSGIVGSSRSGMCVVTLFGTFLFQGEGWILDDICTMYPCWYVTYIGVQQIPQDRQPVWREIGGWCVTFWALFYCSLCLIAGHKNINLPPELLCLSGLHSCILKSLEEPGTWLESVDR